jgi:putative endonuclease
VSFNSYERGWLAETLALALFLLKGYRLIARRYRAFDGEVDLIVQKKGMIVFVEVRARATHALALESIDKHKQERFRRAARGWLRRAALPYGAPCRADCVVLAPWSLPKHIENAFTLDATAW